MNSCLWLSCHWHVFVLLSRLPHLDKIGPRMIFKQMLVRGLRISLWSTRIRSRISQFSLYANSNSSRACRDCNLSVSCIKLRNASRYVCISRVSPITLKHLGRERERLCKSQSNAYIQRRGGFTSRSTRASFLRGTDFIHWRLPYTRLNNTRVGNTYRAFTMHARVCRSRVDPVVISEYTWGHNSVEQRTLHKHRFQSRAALLRK